MKPVINEYVRELSRPGYDAAQRNAFVAAMVSRRLMRRTEEQREAGEADAALASALGDNATGSDARADNGKT
ncbi:hypothetical protein [Achromobacter insolitus]|uniref:hypothetical protein n=1 Tax=Achromobacter insolitus TaxID=217204 RepID=UPI000DD13518|nr:hypothetical protein [Achromobacter insolitus]AXA71767.1 hypothetical protein CE205_14720 [Achromobacter insolitus]MCP1401495.1 hypothetical protein [Achromobacter insolitus]